MPGLSTLEWQTHFSLWCMAAAPLWAGIDLTKMPESALEIFTNAEAIAVVRLALLLLLLLLLLLPPPPVVVVLLLSAGVNVAAAAAAATARALL